MEVVLNDGAEVAEIELPHTYAPRRGARAKRALDLVGALIGIVLLMPLALLVALMIKLVSRGPVLFTQVRMGKHGRCFKMLKFRSMYVDAEERLVELLQDNPALQREYATYHKLQRDPRVTWVGRLVRKYSLDELPQLWNVLKGQMSLVGPRPYLPRERAKMNGAEHAILEVAPGITGFWQVHARNGVSFQDRVRMDVQYVQVRSMGLDLLLLCRTLVVVLRGKDAC